MTSGSPEIPDPNEMLNALLGRVEVAIRETASTASGLPLFVVEEELNTRLRAALPDVRFTAEDIKAWSAQIAS